MIGQPAALEQDVLQLTLKLQHYFVVVRRRMYQASALLLYNDGLSRLEQKESKLGVKEVHVHKRQLTIVLSFYKGYPTTGTTSITSCLKPLNVTEGNNFLLNITPTCAQANVMIIGRTLNGTKEPFTLQLPRFTLNVMPASHPPCDKNWPVTAHCDLQLSDWWSQTLHDMPENIRH